jgi:hypothetical protein
MRTSVNWLFLLAAGSLFWACGGGSSDAGSSSTAGSTSTATCNSTAPAGTDTAACKTCVEQHCGSQYSVFCSANCNANAQSSACQKATTDLGTCVFSNCLSGCDAGSGLGGAPGDPTSGGTTSSGAGKSSTGGGSSGPGNVLSACYMPDMHSCTVFTVPESQRDLVDSQCTSNNGQSADSCPAKNLVGCCAFGGGTAETCGYDADQSPVSEADCMQLSGTWSTTP